jgi:hypothetical protein
MATKPGLYANIHAKQAPTDKAFTEAAKTAKKPTKS